MLLPVSVCLSVVSVAAACWRELNPFSRLRAHLVRQFVRSVAPSLSLGLGPLWGMIFAFLLPQAVDGVSVATDSAAYAVGDPIQVSIDNAGPDRISRGGIACDDIWPLSLEVLDAGGAWQPVPVPQHQCIGIAAALLRPGQTLVRTLSVSLDPGTYHLVYAFDDADTATRQVAYSDPFDVVPSGE